MADSKLTLPGDFQPGRNYLVKGGTLTAWRDALVGDRALPGPGLRESAVPGIGRFLEVVPAPSPTLCPFHAYLYARGTARIDCGRLISRPATGSCITIGNLDADITLTPSLKVWLAISLNTGFEVTGASLGWDSSWPGDAVTWQGTWPDEFQDSARIRVGECGAGELPANTPGFEFSLDSQTGLYHFEQYLHSHLFLALVAYDGKAALFPLPWPG